MAFAAPAVSTFVTIMASDESLWTVADVTTPPHRYNEPDYCGCAVTWRRSWWVQGRVIIIVECRGCGAVWDLRELANAFNDSSGWSS